MNHNFVRLRQWQPVQYQLPQDSNLRLRGWQDSSFDKLKDERFSVVEAPCGSGKSILEIALSIYDSTRYHRKQLILVPQTQIANSFGSKTLVLGGVKYDWSPMNIPIDSDDTFPQRSYNDKLRRFLLEYKCKQTNPYCVSSAVVATHQLFTHLWESLNEQERLAILQNVTIRIDEGHHVSVGSDDRSTILGDFVDFLLANEAKHTANLSLATATFFRADGNPIISNDYIDLFKRDTYSWYDYWHNDTEIEQIEVSYQNYDNDPLALIAENIRSEPDRRHLVIFPPQGNKWRTNLRAVEELRRLLHFLPRNQVLDLVSVEEQGRSETEFEQEKSKFRVIIACRKFDEGTDWPPCDRIHNADCERSGVLALQRMGRGMRHYTGKRHVKIIYYNKPFKAEGDLKKAYAEHVAALCVNMIIVDQFRPRSLPCITQHKSRSNGAIQIERIRLQDAFGNNYQTFMERLIEADLRPGRDGDEMSRTIEFLVDVYALPGQDREQIIKEARDFCLSYSDLDWTSTLNTEELARRWNKIWSKDSVFGANISKQDMEALRKVYAEMERSDYEIPPSWRKFYFKAQEYVEYANIPLSEAGLRGWYRTNAIAYCEETVTDQQRTLLSKLDAPFRRWYQQHKQDAAVKEAERRKALLEWESQQAHWNREQLRLAAIAKRQKTLKEQLHDLYHVLQDATNLLDHEQIEFEGKIYEIVFRSQEIVLKLDHQELPIFRLTEVEREELQRLRDSGALPRHVAKAKLDRLKSCGKWSPCLEDIDFLVQFLSVREAV